MKTRISRRRALVLAGLGLAAGAVALFRSRGYAVSDATREKLVALSASEYAVVRALAARICATDGDGPILDASALAAEGSPVDSAASPSAQPFASAPDAEALDVAGWVDWYLADMDPTMRRDLLRFLRYIEQLAPVASGHSGRFSFLPGAAQDEVLASLESSSQGLLRGGFQGLKALIFMGYYRDPRTWAVLGYDGPTIGRAARPAAGVDGAATEGVHP